MRLGYIALGSAALVEIDDPTPLYQPHAGRKSPGGDGWFKHSRIS